MKTLSAIGFFILLILSFPARALNVFACEPEWASLAQELGGEKVSAFAATTAKQDPHRIEARPSLIARMRAADLVVCSGAELEVGWLPLLFTQAGNARLQPRAAALKGVPVVVYHKDLSYFLNWTGMLEAGSLEPKPGIAPSPTQLAGLVEQMKRSPAKLIVYSAYNSAQAAEFLSGRTG